MALGETPWVDSVWKRVNKRLRDAGVTEAWLPRVHSFKPLNVVEYGAGNWGVVSPTPTPNLVVKLTTNLDEAYFVSLALAMTPPPGIVRYHRLMGLNNVKHEGRDVFVIWRDEAWDVSILNRISYPPDDWMPLSWFDGHAEVAVASLAKLVQQHPADRDAILAEAWTCMKTRQLRPDAPELMREAVRRLATCRKNCLVEARGLPCEPVTDALLHYLDMGILLVSVHLDNIGKDAAGGWIITDPGHATLLDPSLKPARPQYV